MLLSKNSILSWSPECRSSASQSVYLESQIHLQLSVMWQTFHTCHVIKGVELEIHFEELELVSEMHVLIVDE